MLNAGTNVSPPGVPSTKFTAVDDLPLPPAPTVIGLGPGAIVPVDAKYAPAPPPPPLSPDPAPPPPTIRYDTDNGAPVVLLNVPDAKKV
jgi:hypothetical protein